MSRLRWWFGAGIGLVALWLLPLGRLEEHFPCAVQLFIGLDCPGCGLLRSWAASFHGEWGLAFHYYPLGPVLLVLLGLWWLEQFWLLCRGRRCIKGWTLLAANRWGVWGLGFIFLQWVAKLTGFIG